MGSGDGKGLGLRKKSVFVIGEEVFLVGMRIVWGSGEGLEKVFKVWLRNLEIDFISKGNLLEFFGNRKG